MEPGSFTGELEANRFNVQKVLALAQRGRLRVPPFQRPLRWRRQDHLLLLDSLNRGYPVGTLLLWRRPAEAGRVVFGEYAVHAPAIPDALWIVDGQQRITSIVGALMRPVQAGGRRSSEFAFLFDLDKEKFLAGDRTSDAQFVPVNQLWDPVATSQWARTVGASDHRHEQAQQIGARLRAYEIPAYVMTTDSDEVLRTIFERVNTAGARMRREEVFEALNKAFHSDRSPTGLTERLRDGVRSTTFGTLGDDDLQRALICVAGHNPRVPLPEALRKPGAASEWEEPTQASLHRTISFLRDEARIAHASMLPFVLPFILLSGFFHRFPSPRERNVELLVRWVWRGIASQRHMATNEQYNKYFRVMREESEDDVVQGFLRLVPSTSPATFPHADVYNLRGMRTRLELAALFELGPRHLRDDEELFASDIFDADPVPDPGLFGPADPTPGGPRPIELPRIPAKDTTLRRSAGTRLLHPPTPGGDAGLAGMLKKAAPQTLASHLLGGRIEAHTRAGRWDDVVRLRRDELSVLAVQMVARLARWGEDDDGPPLDNLPLGSDPEAEE